MSSRPTVVVYGNCQAEWVSLALQAVPSIIDRYDVQYLYSFDHPVAGKVQPDPAVLDRCVVLLEQRGAWDRFPWTAALSRAVERVTFPALTMDALWPLTTFSDPRCVPVLPDYPYGMFPYGDRLIVEWIASGLSRSETVARYLDWPLRDTEDLARGRELGEVRIQLADATCDVKMADDVLAQIGDQPLFFTCNHPRPALLSRLVDRILQRASFTNACFDEASRLARELFEQRRPNENIQVPVHPHVAEAFGLKWYRPDLVYRCYQLAGLSYEDYWRAYTSYDVAPC